MTATYNSYLDFLASFADSHTMAVEAERNIYPLFADIKKLIGHYQSTISKFKNVQSELIAFIDKLNFDDRDFDYYQELFSDLRKVDNYLQELKSKQVPASIQQKVQDFIIHIYSTASLYELDEVEEKVLSYHNQSAEVDRYERYEKERKEQNTKTYIILGVVLLVIILIIAKCNS